METSMTHECTEELFLKDVATHVMEVIRDDGLYRHVRFKNPDTICMHFDLITWPGYLCYTGDMGTFVFTRLRDMFEFFRRTGKESLFHIDFRYWAEKCEAKDRSDGIKEYSHEKFQSNIRDWIDQAEKDSRPDEEFDGEEAVRLHAAAYAELREAAEDEVCCCEANDVRAYDAANDFEHAGEAWQAFHGEKARFEFSDYWETDNTEYTFRFIWCCYALAWGIRQYDEAKMPTPLADMAIGAIAKAA
jgi:hypothetical protein